MLGIGDSDPVLLIKYIVEDKVEWIGLLDYKPGELDASDSDDSGSETEFETEGHSLGLLEYLIRLCILESTEGVRHWECSEERLGIYLGNEVETSVGIPVGPKVPESPFKVQKTPVKKVMKQL